MSRDSSADRFARATVADGVKIGTTVGYGATRSPANVLQPGRNVVAVRVLDASGGGGIWGVRSPS